METTSGRQSSGSRLGASHGKTKSWRCAGRSHPANRHRSTPARGAGQRTGGTMGLFIVRNQHGTDRCPATDPYMGAMLLNYLSRPNVRQHGITIQGEAVVRGEHTLYMIVESSDEERVRAFMSPFAEAGTVDV